MTMYPTMETMSFVPDLQLGEVDKSDEKPLAKSRIATNPPTPNPQHSPLWATVLSASAISR